MIAPDKADRIDKANENFVTKSIQFDKFDVNSMQNVYDERILMH